MPWGWFQKYPVVLHPITQLNTKHCAKKHPNVCWQIKQNQCWMLKHTDSIELCCVTATEPRADRCTEPYGKHREHKAHHHHSAWEEERSLRTRPPWLCSSLPAGLFPSSRPGSASHWAGRSSHADGTGCILGPCPSRSAAAASIKLRIPALRQPRLQKSSLI